MQLEMHAKIEKVKHCIHAHRGSKPIKRETVETDCVASADAMAHLDNIPSLLYFAFVRLKMNVRAHQIFNVHA